ncbi:NifB/NifX family molybdenum-iron cluster-binding protein [Coraliomargarita sp. SDUM461004]|uniref:NifB/NifX family molybdenum-iron cluster-binding protein n=1 Tax=Thalassobacterium sedimentorum TaxID=3041258 RepID=A0ABU1AMJ9_9BACT|nr:NifB/NifX family molybdenum-iron cluster-binding protein [Coraliomargarita sp. SDUM461004]MDQ8196021.1 NifB/NifX family molybdenum-iron cluster-binding protein [Coraliomargarita sp. SDUM461004]
MKRHAENTITRIAIPVRNNAGLLSKVSAHFGKSPGFIVVDSNGENCHYLDTKSARLQHECAPIRALVQDGGRVILCQSMGRGALARSHEAGLRIYKAKPNSLVAETLSAYHQGDCPDFPDSALCSHVHHEHSHEDPNED